MRCNYCQACCRESPRQTRERVLRRKIGARKPSCCDLFAASIARKGAVARDSAVKSQMDAISRRSWKHRRENAHASCSRACHGESRGAAS